MAMVRFNKACLLCLSIVAYVAVCTNCGWVSENVNVTQHDSVTLSCYSTYSYSPDWRMRKHEDYEIIYSLGKLQTSFQGNGKYRVETSSGFYNLSIFNVTFDDAGEYQCREDWGGGPRHSVFLHVNDADECEMQINACSQFAACVNTPGSFSCKCQPGFKAINGDVIRCDDVDECDNSTTCDVNAFCNNTIGSYTCTCYQGYMELQPVGGCTDLTNVNASVGESVHLPCRSAKHAPIAWMFVASSDAVNGTYLYRNGKITAKKVSAENSNPYDGDYTIVLMNMQFNESGFYVCFEEERTTNRGYRVNINGRETSPVSSSASSVEEREISSAIWSASSLAAVIVAVVVVVLVLVAVFGVIVAYRLRRQNCLIDLLERRLPHDIRLPEAIDPLPTGLYDLYGPVVGDFPLETLLPAALLKTVLVKGVVLVFKRLTKEGKPNADSLAIEALLKVCQFWRHLLGNRPFIERHIEGTLDHFCRPLRRRIGSGYKSVQITKEDGSKSLVRGIATLDNQLFVVSRGSSTVCVFDLTSFTRQPNIQLNGLSQSPQDIAACEFSRRIYIADYGNDCVWYIDRSLSRRPKAADDIDHSPSVVKFIECKGYEPWRLSTSGGRQQLLVTGEGNNSLYVYDVDGELLRRVKLSTNVDDDGVKWDETRHAVQAMTNGNYFVCRLGRYRQRAWTTDAEVAEYNAEGKRLRSYYSGPAGDGQQQVNEPVYMTSIGDGKLLVADSGARRVVLLNSELKLERTLLTRQQLNVDDDDDERWRLCYNSQSGLLCVGMNKGRVNVYKIG